MRAVVAQLCANIMHKDHQKREHSCLGLQTILRGFSDPILAAPIVRAIVPSLLRGIEEDERILVKAELLDSLCTCLTSLCKNSSQKDVKYGPLGR